MTFQLRQREPLMDSRMRQAIKRRSEEAVGLALLATGAVFAIGVATYSPDDAGMLVANNYPVQNLLGRTGADLISRFIGTIGVVTWALPLFLWIWGLRFLLHAGGERFLVRSIFFPFLVLAASATATTFPSPESWPHYFGQGGLLGDSLVGALYYVLRSEFLTSTEAFRYLSIGVTAVLAMLAFGITLTGLRRFTGLLMKSCFRALAAIFGFSLRGFSRETEEDAVDDEFDEYETETEDWSEDRGRSRFGFLRRLPRLGGAARQAGSGANDRHEPRLTRDTELSEHEFEGLPPVDDEIAAERLRAVVEPRQIKKRPISRKAMQETQPPLIAEEETEFYAGPPISLLQEPDEEPHLQHNSQALEENARMLESVLSDYGVHGKIANVRPGPVVTLYELMPEPGLKASRVIGLADDIARNMSALSARISTVPGRNVIGIELPNDSRETVFLKELIADRNFGDSSMELAIALGKDIGGDPKFVDLSRMPHLLIAGTTGSGKSVAINTLILSLLYRLSPEECRFIMIDPKMLELSVYDGIPHLLSPVVTDPKKAVVALKWVAAEMAERYRKMNFLGVRKLPTFNDRVREAQRTGKKLIRRVQAGYDEYGDPIIVEEELDAEPLPYIVVIVDEMAELMCSVRKDVEQCIQRIAQMARASGIHIVMATQRPSVDVITGTIKANFPARVSFQVTTKVDSRTILGEQGAEQLLGRGDMLYMSGGAQISRIHGPFVTDEEVEQIVSHLKQSGSPEYVHEVLEGPDQDVADTLGLGATSSAADSEYDMAVHIVLRDRKCSTSYIQRKMEIGYNKAARLVERMEEEGLISPANHVGKREILRPE
ncbi:MAG: DNA translocase FtsK 4TM domain-containing protein [Rhodobacteraceae bacterium]|nr:DNA translocase FtsK 4TM domain-containing protein [Paracoccaceae bacterium]